MTDASVDSCSAGRLWSLLSQLQGGSSDVKIRDRWQRVLGPAAATERQLYIALAAVHGLVSTVDQDIAALELNSLQRDVFEDSMRHVAKALAIPIHQRVSTMRSELTDSVLTNLYHCALAMLDTTEEPITDEVLEQIRSDVVELQTLISEWRVNGPLRRRLLDVCARLLESIDLHRVTGPEGLSEALDALWGLATRTTPPQDDQGKRIVEKYRVVVAEVMIVLGLVGGLAQLPKAADEGVRTVHGWFAEQPALPAGDQPALPAGDGPDRGEDPDG